MHLHQASHWLLLYINHAYLKLYKVIFGGNAPLIQVRIITYTDLYYNENDYVKHALSTMMTDIKPKR